MVKRGRKTRIARRRPVVSTSVIPIERIEGRILVIRGHKVILDRDLAVLYGVSAKALKQAIRRNADRFPEDFVFQLTWEEARFLRSQSVTLDDPARAALRRSPPGGRGAHAKYTPYAFTEQGVAMLSSVLRSPRAVRVNIEIMRAFVNLRKLLASHADLARRIDELEAKYDENFKAVFDAIRMLMAEPEPEEEPRKTPIGFRAPDRPQIEPKPNARRRPALAR